MEGGEEKELEDVLFLNSTFSDVYHVPDDRGDLVISGESSVALSVSYSLRHAITSPFRADAKSAAYATLRKLSNSNRLNAVNATSYYTINSLAEGWSLSISLTETPTWLKQSVEPILQPQETLMFLILALLALTHTLHLFEYITILVFPKCRCQSFCSQAEGDEKTDLLRSFEKGGSREMKSPVVNGFSTLLDDDNIDYLTDY